MDLTTKYLGLTLKNPLIVAACPLTREIHRIEQLEQAGAAAAVVYSLFAEQMQNDPLSNIGKVADPLNDSMNEMPLPADYIGGIDAYLRLIELSKKSVSIPLIGSLNASDSGDWIQYARLIEQAGVDALELNVYFVPTDPAMTGAQVEEKYFEIIAAVREQVKIPLSIKLGPFFSSLPNMASRLNALGVDGLVLFNRFLQPDIDIQTIEVSPKLTLSTRDELRLPLRWIAILRSQVALSLASSSGAHCGEDVVKLLLAGADAVSMASALLINGPGHLTTVLNELQSYMSEKGIESIEGLRGLVTSRPGTNATAFERANYIKMLHSYDSDKPQ